MISFAPISFVDFLFGAGFFTMVFGFWATALVLDDRRPTAPLVLWAFAMSLLLVRSGLWGHAS